MQTDLKTITVYNKQDKREESFTELEALDWLEAAHEMYSATDVKRLMMFGRA